MQTHMNTRKHTCSTRAQVYAINVQHTEQRDSERGVERWVERGGREGRKRERVSEGERRGKEVREKEGEIMRRGE